MKAVDINGSNTLSLSLFIDVTNSKELLDSMQAGKLEPEVALLNASLITESLKRCGISDSTTYILAARFNASPDEVRISYKCCGLSLYISLITPRTSTMKAVEKLVNGKEIELEELEGRANQAQIQKHYKISGLEAGLSSLADAITCRIAARDAL
ncbi:EKC/KEOPS complex subunit Tprkb [Populus alba x Populus x berolinensis]|nr:EKC/KEOPS complex subunit Tprkb [Populus alba x Populus x berolinensis]